MSFKTVYEAILDQLMSNITLRRYVPKEAFFEEYSAAFPNLPYVVFMEPGMENPEGDRASRGLAEAVYNIEVVGRMSVPDLDNRVLGDRTNKGILEFSGDILAALRSDLTFGLDAQGTSISRRMASATYNLGANIRYLTVTINGNTPSGYDRVDCGIAPASGTVIAAQIQTSLRALVDTKSKTGFADVTVTYDNALKRFTITSQEYGALSSVVVGEGAEKDASTILGFDNPFETRGVRIIRVEFQMIEPLEDLYPVAFRSIPISVHEEVFIND